MSSGDRAIDAAVAAPLWQRWLVAGRGRVWATVFALVWLAALWAPEPGPVPGLRHYGFDAYQTLWPRQRQSSPVAIVAIDEASLDEIGQWPWPRDTLAQLVDAIAARGPVVIGLDLILREPDRSSPEQLATQYRARDPALAQRLAALETHDALLAAALNRAGAVTGLAGVDGLGAGDAGEGLAAARTLGPMPPLQGYAGGLRNLPGIDRAGAGRGLFNSYVERGGVIRRMPLVATVAGQPVLSLPMEILRVAASLPVFTLDNTGADGLQVVLGDLRVPAQADGSLWVHFADPEGQWVVSAADVLRGRDDPGDLADRVVLLGVTGLGLVDQQATPLGVRVPGVEVHAQVLENIFDDSLLQRPRWARGVESAAFAAFALLAIACVPRWSPRRSPWLFVVSVVVLLLAGASAYFHGQRLFDPLTPLLGLALLQGVLTAATLVRSDSERRRLAGRLAVEREAAARTAGELEAARRIQSGMLPVPASVVGGDARLELFARMRPAREVGGDLYDFFFLDEQRLFVVVGDVAGKGVPAALFMAVSKALTRAITRLTDPQGCAGLERLLAEINDELVRDNPEDFFVTLLAMVLDLDSGRLLYCSAGHEPLVLLRGDGRSELLEEGGGPPLCVVESARFRAAEARLAPHDLLVLLSDGLTEAVAADGRLYGRSALRQLLESSPRRQGPVDALAAELLAEVDAFEAGTETSDDQTLVLLRWLGDAGDRRDAGVSAR